MVTFILSCLLVLFPPSPDRPPVCDPAIEAHCPVVDPWIIPQNPFPDSPPRPAVHYPPIAYPPR